MLFAPLIAFGLTSPAMLAWLAVAAAPLLIHFFSRRRYRETAWAAMEYLAAAMRQSRRRMRLEQLLLLAVRTLVVVLAVLAVAELYLEQGGFAFAPGGVRTHRLLVVDGSYSMACKDDEGLTRFERAKSLACRLVEESPTGDGFTLILMSSPPQVVVGTPALETDAFLAELKELAIRQTTFDLPMTLERVEEVLARARRVVPGLKRAEVYFFTDMGKVGWQPKFSGATSENVFRQRVRRLAKAAEVAVIDVGEADVYNRALTDVRVDEPFATLARPLGITARVKNFGARPMPEQGVELWVDGRRAAKQSVDLAAGGSAVLRFSHRFSTPGEHVIEIRTQADRLDVDNHRWLALSVKPCLRVLCVDGHPMGGASGGGATAYLKVALAPQEGKLQQTLVCPQVVPESGLMELDLDTYDCVFLCNVAQFTSSEALALTRYVEEGGGLVFFMGDRVLPDRYNRRLAESDEAGMRLLPARLEGLIEKRQTGLNPLDYRHPIVEKFRGREQAGLLTTPVAKMFKLSLPDNSKANVVLATNDGEPLIVEEAMGLGRVVLVATSADTSWGPMPMWPSFVPLVHEILAYAVGGQTAVRNRLVGDMLEGPIIHTPLSLGYGVAAASADGCVEIQTPKGQRVKAPVGRYGDRLGWSFDDTVISGIYTVEFGHAPLSGKQSPGGQTPAEQKQTSSLVYAVNIDTVESDLTTLSEEQLRSGVFAGVPIEYQTTWSRSEAAPLSPIARRGQLAAALLYAVFALLLLESFLAWRFGHHSL